MAEEMLTAKKIADKYEISEGKIKKAIKEMSIEADQKKGRCNYYSEETAKKIIDSMNK